MRRRRKRRTRMSINLKCSIVCFRKHWKAKLLEALCWCLPASGPIYTYLYLDHYKYPLYHKLLLNQVTNNKNWSCPVQNTLFFSVQYQHELMDLVCSQLNIHSFSSLSFQKLDNILRRHLQLSIKPVSQNKISSS